MKKPRITEAQSIADRIGAKSVVVIAFGGGMVAGASYGATKAECAAAGKWLDSIIDSMTHGCMAVPHDYQPDREA